MTHQADGLSAPCPFCGSRENPRIGSVIGRSYVPGTADDMRTATSKQAQCECCGAMGPAAEYDANADGVVRQLAEEAALGKWNSRRRANRRTR